jgi:hypothetical protein
MTAGISRIALAGVALSGVLLGTPVVAANSPLTAVEQPLAPERNPPGDVPDDQVFVDYASPLGFAMKVPEGWARRDLADGAYFADKYDAIAVRESAARATPDTAGAERELVPVLARDHRAVTVAKIEAVALPAGLALRVEFGSNSEPNPVTGKAIRLENERYYFWRDGRLVILELSAPAGADNADQWRLVADSFRWRP